MSLGLRICCISSTDPSDIIRQVRHDALAPELDPDSTRFDHQALHTKSNDPLKLEEEETWIKKRPAESDNDQKDDFPFPAIF